MKKSRTDNVFRSRSLTACESQPSRKSTTAANGCKTDSKPTCFYKRDRHIHNVDKTNVVKTVIRNPVDKSKSSSSLPKTKGNVSSPSSKKTVDVIPSSSVDSDYDLKVPSLCTALRIADNILTATADTKSDMLCDLPTKLYAKKKVLNKVNFPLEKHLYKDLVSLQITENDVGAKCTKTFSKAKDVTRKKDPVPKLSDFYKPSFTEEITAPSSPIKIKPDKIQYYDGNAIINRAKTWETKY